MEDSANIGEVSCIGDGCSFNSCGLPNHKRKAYNEPYNPAETAEAYQEDIGASRQNTTKRYIKNLAREALYKTADDVKKAVKFLKGKY